MRKIGLGISLLMCLPATARSQEQPPQLLLHAAQCLEAKEFLPSLNATRLTFGYFLDEKSYAPAKVIYVVNYATPARSNGLVFAVFLSENNGYQKFNVQNNASFVLSKSELIGVSFKDPPLGGTWTQEHLASAIKQIEKQRRFTIPVTDLSSMDTSISCEAYTDPHRKASKRGADLLLKVCGPYPQGLSIHGGRLAKGASRRTVGHWTCVVGWPCVGRRERAPSSHVAPAVSLPLGPTLLLDGEPAPGEEPFGGKGF